jgi:hypothetical protein
VKGRGLTAWAMAGLDIPYSRMSSWRNAVSDTKTIYLTSHEAALNYSGPQLVTHSQRDIFVVDKPFFQQSYRGYSAMQGLSLSSPTRAFLYIHIDNDVWITKTHTS